MEIALFAILLLFIEIIGTIGGFGSSILLVPIAMLYIPFNDVLLVTATIHVFSNASKIYLFQGKLNKELLIRFGIPSVVFVSIGAFFSKYLNLILAETLMGLFLVGFSLFLLIKKNYVPRINATTTFVSGTLSGLIAGLLGTGGAIRGLFLSALNVEKNLFVFTSSVIDFAVDSTRFTIYLQNSDILKRYITFIPLIVLSSLMGSYLGKLILEKIPQEKFKSLVLLLILFTGAFMLYNVSRL